MGELKTSVFSFGLLNSQKPSSHFAAALSA